MQINIYKKAETQARARRNFTFPFVPKLMFDELEKLTNRGTNITAWLKKEFKLQGCMVFAMFWEYEILYF